MPRPRPAATRPASARWRPSGAACPWKAMDVRGRIDGLLAQVTRSPDVRQHARRAAGGDVHLPAARSRRGDRASAWRSPAASSRACSRSGRGAASSTTEAIAAGHRAAIAEEERPGVFTLRVGNLMPGEAATVRLTLVGPAALRRRRGHVPVPAGRRAALHPRRAAAGPVGRRRHGARHRRRARRLADHAAGAAARLPQPGAAGARRRACTPAAGAVDDFRSSLHAVCVEDERRRRGGSELQPGERLDRDFILRFRLGADGVRIVADRCMPDARRRRRGTFVLTLVPPPARRPPAAGRATWCSCSTAPAAWRAGRWWRPAGRWRGWSTR